LNISADVNFNGNYVQDIDTSARVAALFKRLHHFERYSFIKRILPKRKRIRSILDAGTGDARGLVELHHTLKPSRCVGIEVDKTIARRSQRNCPFLSIINANIEDFKPKETFELVVCFEVLGHKSLKSDMWLMRKLVKWCAPDGYIFISTPNYSNMSRTKDYHARLYNPKSFAYLINQTFTGCRNRFFGQIYPLKRMFRSQVGIWDNEGFHRDADFLICVAHNQNREGKK
jgi:2-polyprenyl-3-methyl-5-hydroxy-6-metoxy-1,4-benzoquinol methylase